MSEPPELDRPFDTDDLDDLAGGPQRLPPAERPSLAELRAQAQGPAGLECPECGCRDFRVVNTWPVAGGAIHRTRRCRHCGYPIPTTEQVREEDGGN